MTRACLIALPLLLGLTACDSGSGTNISISGDNGSAGVVNGVASIDVPGFKGELRLPKFQIDAGKLDVNGVKLFPGSTVGNVDVNARDGQDDGRVRIAFESPAAVDQVRQHLSDQFAKAGFKVAVDGTGLSGTTKDGKPVKLTLAAAGTDKARGELTLGK